MTRSDFGSCAEYGSDAEYIRRNEVEPGCWHEGADRLKVAVLEELRWRAGMARKGVALAVLARRRAAGLAMNQ